MGLLGSIFLNGTPAAHRIRGRDDAESAVKQADFIERTVARNTRRDPATRWAFFHAYNQFSASLQAAIAEARGANDRTLDAQIEVLRMRDRKLIDLLKPIIAR